MALTKIPGELINIDDLDLTNVGTLHLDTIVSDASPAAITVGYGGSDTLTINGLTTMTTDGNEHNLTLLSTDADANIGPTLSLYRNSASPADNDELGRIYFYGENDNDEKIEYTLIRSTIVDASDSAEGSALQMYTYTAGGQKSRLELLEGETVFNEGSSDIDFRVESDGSANMLVVDAGNNKVLVEAQNTASVTNAASMIAASAFEINGNAGEGSDILRFFAMADATGAYGMEVSNSSGASTYKLKINPINGGNLYSGGNLEFPSGKGIDFSATGDATGTDTSELLDDYEEGYASLQIGPDGNLSANWSGTTNNAKYVKIGRFCYVTFDITTTDKGDGSGSYATITNLPFTPVSGTGGSNASGGGFIAYSVNPTTSSVYGNVGLLYIMTTMGGTAYLAWSTVQDNTRLIGTVMFHTA